MKHKSNQVGKAGQFLEETDLETSFSFKSFTDSTPNPILIVFMSKFFF